MDAEDSNQVKKGRGQAYRAADNLIIIEFVSRFYPKDSSLGLRSTSGDKLWSCLAGYLKKEHQQESSVDSLFSHFREMSNALKAARSNFPGKFNPEKSL